MNVPLDALRDHADAIGPDRDRPILTLCRIGEKSLYASLLLKAMGYRQVMTVMGGLEAWQAEGLPTTYGQEAS